MNHIGLIGRGHQYIKLAFVLVFVTMLFINCGTAPHKKIYRIYEVDEQPLYNGEEWQSSLLKDFNAHFITTDHDNMSRICVEFIIDQNGHLKELKCINKASELLSDFERDVLLALNSCQNWSPAIKQGKPVCMKATISLSISPR